MSDLIRALQGRCCVIMLMSIALVTSYPLTHSLSVCAEDVPQMGYEQRLNQARLYIDNQMLLPALNELKQLAGTSRGRADSRVFTALAGVHYKLHNITAALSNLRKARKYAEGDTRERLTKLYDQWLNMYGLVRFESADSRGRGAITPRVGAIPTCLTLSVCKAKVLKFLNDMPTYLY